MKENRTNNNTIESDIDESLCRIFLYHIQKIAKINCHSANAELGTFIDEIFIKDINFDETIHDQTIK